MPRSYLLTQVHDKKDKPGTFISSELDKRLTQTGVADIDVRGNESEIRYGVGQKESLVAGYHFQGLPFHILLHAVNKEEDQLALDELKRQLPSLMTEYILFLMHSDDHSQVTEDMVCKIQRLISTLPTNGIRVSFNAMYEKDGELFVTGFSRGTFGTLLKRENESVTQLLRATYLMSRDIKVPIEASYHVPISRGDEVITYSRLPSELLEEKKGLRKETFRDFDNNPFVHTDELRYEQVKLHSFVFTPNKSFFEILKDRFLSLGNVSKKKIEEQDKREVEMAVEREAFKIPFLQELYPHIVDEHKEREKKRIRYKMDKALICSMRAPDENLQHTLTIPIEVVEEAFEDNIYNLKVATEEYLTWMNQHARGKRVLGGRFSHWYHGDSGRNRAIAILQKINDHAPYLTILKAVNNAIKQSGHHQHSYSRYIYDGLLKSNHEEDTVGRVSDDVFFCKKKLCM